MSPDSYMSTPFAELPAALVEELLSQTASVGDQLLDSFRQIRADREKFREALKAITKNDSSYGYPPLPTTCGTDGSYAVERLLSTDLAAAAAVAVEGLTPPSEKRHWDQPHHSTFVVSERHHADTATILRAVMLGRELMLATQAPHDLVMLDMTLTLPIIYFNQALNQAKEGTASDLNCSKEFLSHASEYLDAYKSILTATRSDRNYLGLPKYSTRREICLKMKWPAAYDDRGLLTMLLKAGELTTPVQLEQPDKEWHLNTGVVPEPTTTLAKELGEQIITALKNVHVFYYKPHEWLPALRVEVSKDIATNNHRLAVVLQGLKYQCATAGMLEPYPLYLADRTVKALARSIPAFRQVATQRIAEKYEGDIGEVFFAMHGYRSDSGG